MKCELCGCDPHQAAERGACFIRVNETGVEGVWQCKPSCDRKHGDQDDALLTALGETDH